MANRWRVVGYPFRNGTARVQQFDASGALIWEYTEALPRGVERNRSAEDAAQTIATANLKNALSISYTPMGGVWVSRGYQNTLHGGPGSPNIFNRGVEDQISYIYDGEIVRSITPYGEPMDLIARANGDVYILTKNARGARSDAGWGDIRTEIYSHTGEYLGFLPVINAVGMFGLHELNPPIGAHEILYTGWVDPYTRQTWAPVSIYGNWRARYPGYEWYISGDPMPALTFGMWDIGWLRHHLYGEFYTNHTTMDTVVYDSVPPRIIPGPLEDCYGITLRENLTGTPSTEGIPSPDGRDSDLRGSVFVNLYFNDNPLVSAGEGSGHIWQFADVSKAPGGAIFVSDFYGDGGGRLKVNTRQDYAGNLHTVYDHIDGIIRYQRSGDGGNNWVGADTGIAGTRPSLVMNGGDIGLHYEDDSGQARARSVDGGESWTP